MQPYSDGLASLAAGLTGLSDRLAGLPDWQAFLVVVGASVLAAAVVQVGGDVLVKRLTARVPGDVDDAILGRLHPALWVTVLLGGSYFGVAQVGAAAGLLAPLQAATLTVVALVWTVTAFHVGRVVIEASADSSYVDRQVVPIFQNVWSALVVGVALFLLLSFWKVDVTPLLASAGVVGIVIGLAAKDTLANFFGSIALYADGTYAVGDYVVLESGDRGRVEDISVRSTVVRTRDDILVTVPNAELTRAAVVNESTPRRYRRVKIPVSVAYGTDVDRVEAIMLDVAAEADLVRDKPDPRVRLREFGDSGLEIELLCWIDHPRLRGRAVDKLMRAVYTEFREAGIEIPYPQREVRMVGEGSNGERADAVSVDSLEPSD